MAAHDRAGTFAILLHADVAGSTSLVQQDEHIAHERMQGAFRRFSDTIVKYHGRVRELRGDALLAEFERASDAVAAALAFQVDQTQHITQIDDAIRPEVRVGIAMGEFVFADNTVTGAGVVLAQRIEQLAEPGQVCITAAIHESLPQRMPFDQEYLGEREVKGFNEPVRVYLVRLQEGAEIPEPVVPSRKKRAPVVRWSMAAVVVVMTCVGGLLLWYQPWAPEFEPVSPEAMIHPLPDRPSIAVLALDDLSQGAEQGYLSDAISEGIITQLSHFSELFVVARNSSFFYKGKATDVRDIAAGLGARYILEGSQQKAGDKLRVTVQLLDAVAGNHIWSSTYDRDLSDLFAVQDEIANTVASTVGAKVVVVAGEEAKRVDSKRLQAFQYWLKGTRHWYEWTEEGNEQARLMYRKAVETDPKLPRGHLGLAWVNINGYRWGWTDLDRDEALSLARKQAQRGLNLAPQDYFPHQTMANVLMQEGEREQAIVEFEKALMLNPNAANVMMDLSEVLVYSGQALQAIELMRRAMRLDPHHPDWFYWNLGWALWYVGAYDEALAAITRMSSMPNLARRTLAVIYVGLDQTDEARATIAELLENDPEYSITDVRANLGNKYKYQADAERFIDGLRTAGLPENPPLELPDKPSIAVLPFTNMSDDPQQEYFVDGMTEDLITDLSKISGLFVIARNSSFTYKGKAVDVKTVARDLGVRSVLEGSVRRAGDQVRINAQLVDVTTGGHLWAERYDGTMTDVFALQDKVTQKIVGALAVTLSADDRAKQLGQETDSFQAYDAFLQGWEHYRRQNRQDYQGAKKYLERAISLDPEYSRAYAVLAEVHRRSAYLGWYLGDLSAAESLERAKLYLRGAMKHPTPLAHQVAAKMLARDGQHDEAIAEAERAIALDTNDPAGHMAVAEINVLGGAPDKALSHIQAAMRLDPFFPADYLFWQGLAEFNLERYDEAIVTLERAVDRNPGYYPLWTALVSAQGHLGRMQDAQASIDLANEHRANVGRAPLSLTVVDFWRFKDPEDAERLHEGLREAGVPDLPFNYNGSAENKLDGDEIRDLLFGRTYSGRDPYSGSDWHTTIESDGRATTEAPWYSGPQVRWIEDGLLCHRSEGSAPESRVCGFIFRNPKGTRQKRDEYHWVGGPGIYPFSLVD